MLQDEKESISLKIHISHSSYLAFSWEVKCVLSLKKVGFITKSVTIYIHFTTTVGIYISSSNLD